MATNCPQQVKPRAWRSALCLRTVDSNSRREKSCRICENMLHTRFKAEPPKSVIGFWRNSISTYQRLSFFRISSQIRNLDKSALKHSDASNLWIRIWPENGAIEVE